MKSPLSLLNRSVPVGWLFLGVVAALPALAQQRYTITNLGTIGGSNTTPLAISSNGIVVGHEFFSSSRFNRPFVYRNGTMTEVGSYGDTLTQATGVNAAGTILVTSYDLNANTTISFSYLGATATPLPTLGGSRGTTASAINAAGVIVGISYTANNLGLRAFSFANGVMTNLGTLATGPSYATAINSAGVAVGHSDIAVGGFRHAVRFSGGTVTDLGTLGGPESFAVGINDSGVIVGHANIPGGVADFRAFVYANGTMTDIGTLGFTSVARGINSAGTVVGAYGAGFVHDRAFIYTPAGGMVDLNTLVVNLATSGFSQLLEARAVNDAGQIVGRGRLGNDFGAFLLTPSTAPVVTAHPQSHTVAPGSSVVFSVVATGTALQYQWLFNNTAITGATDATYRIAAAANAGAYTVRVNSGGESATSDPATLTVTPGVAGRLINLSILTALAGASDSFTMGYVVGGAGTSGAKPLVIRAAGPALTALGVGGALADPKLEFFAGQTKSGENDNWGGSATLLAAMNAVGAFPFTPTGAPSLDAAVAVSAAAGDNSVKVTPVGNLSGAVIAEIYDATLAANFTAATPRLINVSVLKSIGTSLTAGFVVGGSASKTVLIRAIGPTLAGFGVGGTVTDPQLALFNAAAAKIGDNDNWGGTAALTAAFTAVGAFQLSGPTSRDAALVATLQPGNYTVQVSGVGNTTGTALVEVYEVP